MAKPEQITPDQIAVFNVYLGKWQDALNLRTWRVCLSKDRPKGVMANVSMDVQAALAEVRIGKDIGHRPITEGVLESTALHELLHVFLKRLIVAASESGAESERTGAEEHAVVAVLEHLLMQGGNL